MTSDFPFSTLNKEFRKFESLDIWNLLKDGHTRLLPWYFAVSTNRMPAKYLISKSISCNVAKLLASEEELWEEHRELMETFLERNQVRRYRHNISPGLAEDITHGLEY